MGEGARIEAVDRLLVALSAVLDAETARSLPLAS
jgi:hypothetical protein